MNLIQAIKQVPKEDLKILIEGIHHISNSYKNDTFLGSYVDRISFEDITPGDIIVITRTDRNGAEEQIIGYVQSAYLKVNHYVDIVILRFLLGEKEFPRRAGKVKKMRNNINYRIYKLDSPAINTESFKQQRAKYASARSNMLKARAVAKDSFTILGIDRNISQAQFKVIKRKMMLKFHPDKVASHKDTREQFLIKSKEFTDALSFVEAFIKNRDNRLK